MTEQMDEILDRAGIGVATLETTGRYMLVNDSYCRMLGRTREELLGLGLQDVTYPDDLPKSLDAFIMATETGARRAFDQRYVQTNGTPVWVRNTVSAVYDGDGKPQFLVVVAHTGSEGVGAEPLGTAESDLRLLLDAAADGFYCLDREGNTTLCNAAFLRMLGFEREADVLGTDIHDIVHHSHADGSPYPRSDCPIYKATRSGTPAHVADEVFFRRDGTSFPVEYWVRPILRDGQIHGAVCTFVDLTARKQIEARQELLNRELSHRVKNTLAMVQAIVGQTLRTVATPLEALRSIEGRLVALSEAHNVLMRTRWGNASIIDVAEGATAPHRSDAARIRLNGPSIDLGSKAALALTLALHELCTNAAKYGALSNDTGIVNVDWSLTGGAANARFNLTWKESGGPPVAPPQRKGFGSRLIADRFGSDFEGEATLLFKPSGVVWTLDAPLASMRE